MEYLENWFKPFENYKKLTLDEAKKKYLEIMEIEDPDLKEKELNELIYSTLYVVHNYLNNNDYYLNINLATFDVDDVINSFVEEWIKIVKEGKLLTVLYYQQLFSNHFINTIMQRITGEEGNYFFQNKSFYDKYNFVPDFKKYIDLRNANESVSYEEVFKTITGLDTNSYIEEYGYNDYYYYECCINLFSKIYDIVRDKDSLNVEINKKRIFDYIIPFIELSQFVELNDTIKSRFSYEDYIIEKINEKELLDYIESIQIADRNREILYRKHGLFNKEQESLQHMSKDFNVKRQRIDQLYNDTIRKIRRREYTKEYF